MSKRYVRRGLLGLIGVLIAMVGPGCVPGTVQHATTPPEGAVQAELGFPSVGSTAVIQTVDHGTGIISTRTYTVLEESTHGGRPVYRVSDGAKHILVDKATGNWIADVRAGKELSSASPSVAFHSFPLWVGKSWETPFTYHDRERGARFANVVWQGEVTAYEDVTVPAGTFKTFKVEGTAGSEKRVAWYSPKLKFEVKTSIERFASHYLGAGKFTSELIEYSVK